MAKLIALCGPQQVGKSSAAKSLVEHYGFVHLSFADPLYRMVAALLGITLDEVRQLPKGTPLQGLEWHTLRHALQTLGTEWGRAHLGENLWCNAAIRRAHEHIANGQSVVIDDCRFRNEYEALQQAGAFTVGLERFDLPTQDNPQHGSEVEWKQFEVDATVTNPGTPEWLNDAGRHVLDAVANLCCVAY